MNFSTGRVTRQGEQSLGKLEIIEKWVKTDVSAYSGYRVNEKPLSLLVNNEVIYVEDWISQWRDPDNDYFKVKTQKAGIIVLKWSRKQDQWFYYKVSQ